MTDDGQTFHSGGYIPGGTVQVTLDALECIIAAADLRAGRCRCSRADDAHLKAAHSRGQTP